MQVRATSKGQIAIPQRKPSGIPKSKSVRVHRHVRFFFQGQSNFSSIWTRHPALPFCRIRRKARPQLAPTRVQTQLFFYRLLRFSSRAVVQDCIRNRPEPRWAGKHPVVQYVLKFANFHRCYELENPRYGTGARLGCRFGNAINLAKFSNIAKCGQKTFVLKPFRKFNDCGCSLCGKFHFRHVFRRGHF